MLRLRSVVGILLGCRPSTVGWLVVAIIVDAIKLVLGRRLRSHVLIELGEVAPACAYLDSTAIVSMALGIPTRQSASVSHAPPGAILWRATSPMRSQSAREAPSGQASGQILKEYLPDLSAGASTFDGILHPDCGGLKYHPPTEGGSGFDGSSHIQWNTPFAQGGKDDRRFSDNAGMHRLRHRPRGDAGMARRAQGTCHRHRGSARCC